MHATSARNMQQKQLSGTAMATLLGQEKEQPRHRRRPKTSRTAGYRYEKLRKEGHYYTLIFFILSICPLLLSTATG